MALIIAVAEHVRGARCADKLGALPHTLLDGVRFKAQR